MIAIQALLRRHPLTSYFVLVFALSWGALFLLFGADTALGGWADSTGLGFVTLVLGTLLGPTVAGLGLTAALDGRAGLRELRARLLRWRVGGWWYAVALLTAPLCATGVLFALSLVTPTYLPGFFAGQGVAVAVLGSLIAAAVIGLFEEIGWTGFAIPWLRRRHGTLGTGLFVGVLWGAWHGPLFWSAARLASPRAWPLVLAVMLFSFLPPYRVLLVWVHDRTGSLLIPALMHTSLTATTVVFQLLGRGIPTVPFDLALAAGFWAVIALGAGVVRARRPFHPMRPRMA
jgi:uncharacterized protein